MKKGRIWIIIIAIIAILVLWFVKLNNRMVAAEEKAVQAWSQVENVYQRRSDLIPNLVATVKGAADFERGTLEAVIEARAKATSVTVDPSNLTEESMAAFQSAQDNLSQSLGRLMVVIERYPELKANQNFLELQAQLEGTENRITVERRSFNETVQSYNTLIRKFPNSIIAGIAGFEKKAYFKAAEGADKAPVVEF
ncbi:MAG: LemA family protein [Bacteroidales bacterium]|jgi:LemA protein|nr:LemA family protein [Bacteroidales bacterium]MDD4257067.1 LemA family protein [Bacteroidales bacterium]MDD4654713.1 LemA family protein [Bacteroidales bacterium]HNY24092.1 LemA family protein [Bacteroidales bacterium]HPS23948.1 LemA family protein [Bacteroidales bacterium]